MLAHLWATQIFLRNTCCLPHWTLLALSFIHLLLDKIASQIFNLVCFFGSNFTQISDIHIFYNRILLFADSWQKFTQLNGSWALQNDFVRPHTTKNVFLHNNSTDFSWQRQHLECTEVKYFSWTIVLFFMLYFKLEGVAFVFIQAPCRKYESKYINEVFFPKKNNIHVKLPLCSVSLLF